MRQSAMNRAKAADKKVAATAGPAAITQAYNAKRAELAGAEDTKLQLYIRTGEVRPHNCRHSQRLITRYDGGTSATIARARASACTGVHGSQYPPSAVVLLQKSVVKLNGHMEEVRAAIEHEADKLKDFEADQTALKGRCRLLQVDNSQPFGTVQQSAQIDTQCRCYGWQMLSHHIHASSAAFCSTASRDLRIMVSVISYTFANHKHLGAAAPRMQRRR